MVLVDVLRRLRGDSSLVDAEDSYRRIEFTTRETGSGLDRLRCRCRRCGQAFESPKRLDAHECPSLDDGDGSGGGSGRLVADGGRDDSDREPIEVDQWVFERFERERAATQDAYLPAFDQSTFLDSLLDTLDDVRDGSTDGEGVDGR